MVATYYMQYGATQQRVARWSTKLHADVTSYFGSDESTIAEAKDYHAILMLSARQILAANVITEHYFSGEPNPVIFQKEISSDGKTNTADVIYPAIPFYVYTEPVLLRLLLQPLYDYQKADLYRRYGNFAMHDIGRWYPNAVGYNDSNTHLDEVMPVEECGNMILITYAYYQATNDTTYPTSHWAILDR